MASEPMTIRPEKRILQCTLFLVLCFLVAIVIGQRQKQESPYQNKRQFAAASSFFSSKECSPDEKRIARHFAADTLPGLMQKGLIRKYSQSTSGTSITVNGKLWKGRSIFFKKSLLTEIMVFNKVQGCEVPAKIIDGLSGKLYASISPSKEMNFYD